jgi:hypothetical protein
MAKIFLEADWCAQFAQAPVHLAQRGCMVRGLSDQMIQFMAVWVAQQPLDVDCLQEIGAGFSSISMHSWIYRVHRGLNSVPISHFFQLVLRVWSKNWMRAFEPSFRMAPPLAQISCVWLHQHPSLRVNQKD